MKKSIRPVMFVFLCCLVLLITTSDAYADNVLQAVRDKAASFLHDLQPVIFILAGFGLVGFAWMAIFNKISWKWFANIAMGLFLVANMGLFIDYFATKSGNKGQYHQKLDYGDYLIDSPLTLATTPGTSESPKSQSAKNDGTVTGDDKKGETPNSDSSQIGSGGSFADIGLGLGGTGSGLGGNGGLGGLGGSSAADDFAAATQDAMNDVNNKMKSLAKDPVECAKYKGTWMAAINKCI